MKTPCTAPESAERWIVCRETVCDTPVGRSLVRQRTSARRRNRGAVGQGRLLKDVMQVVLHEFGNLALAARERQEASVGAVLVERRRDTHDDQGIAELTRGSEVDGDTRTDGSRRSETE
jgi:hypothetical protein